MARYGRIVNGRVIDAHDLPSPMPAWAVDDATWLAEQFPTLSGWVVLPEGTLNGATDNGDGTYTPPAQKPPKPKVLEPIEFIRHAAAQITETRVMEIEEAFAGHANKQLKYAYREYDKAKSFTKDKVDEFLTAGVAASILTAQEKADVLDNWPT